MTKEEIKANELIEMFRPTSYCEGNTYNEREQIQIQSACECAIICVDEILKWFNTHKFISINDDDDSVDFWQSVKEILEKK